MGETPTHEMMGSRTFLLTLLAVSCHGLPQTAEDDVVPERQTMLLQHTAAFTKMSPTAFISAMASSGGSEQDCRTFADETIKTIDATVISSQGTMDEVATGSSCAALGQDEVQAETAKVAAAKLVLQNAEAVAASKKAAKVTAAKAPYEVTFNLMSTNTPACVDVSGQSSYLVVKNALDNAVTELEVADKAVGVAKTKAADAQTALDGVEKEASRLMSGCLCQAHKKQKAAWAAVSTATAAHAADWKSAHEVICALDKTATCNVPTCPTVTQPTVADGVANADSEHCTAAPTTAPTLPPAKCSITMGRHSQTATWPHSVNTGRNDAYDSCGTSVSISGDCTRVMIYDNDDDMETYEVGAVHGSKTYTLPFDLKNDCAGYYLVPGY